jgi:hypothetical protein
MADILHFPTKTVRDAVAIEATIREILGRTPADSTAVDAIASRMREFVTKFGRSFSVTVADTTPQGIQAGLSRLESELHALMNEIILERTSLEIERHYLLESRNPG